MRHDDLVFPPVSGSELRIDEGKKDGWAFYILVAGETDI
jgi:hypothetical protein